MTEAHCLATLALHSDVMIPKLNKATIVEVVRAYYGTNKVLRRPSALGAGVRALHSSRCFDGYFQGGETLLWVGVSLVTSMNVPT